MTRKQFQDAIHAAAVELRLPGTGVSDGKEIAIPRAADKPTDIQVQLATARQELGMK